MKILLDENIDIRFRKAFSNYEVYTVAYLNWCGIENGKLLALMQENNFSVLITRDQGLYHEQLLEQMATISVILFMSSSGKLSYLNQKLNDILEILNSIELGKLYIIE